ncbi:hypothetical protein BDY19DRAFT_988052 [Irpex rosettiformis]|uniref:Uncharacterized protein n=1 Tax=Irpex rosettiformis TaxID=378272 RepID=A0ACB8UJ24_9APHY|nr:hypothetical protein BDY19DRAFT_988052 [Irpex rosettiformis]
MSIMPREEQTTQSSESEDSDDSDAWLEWDHSPGPPLSRYSPPPDPPTLDLVCWLQPADDRPYGHTAGHVPCQHDPLFHERVAKLCANLPPEMFYDILFYVDYDTRRFYTDLRRKLIECDQDSLSDLKRCSLVCRYWANHCRKYIFRDKRLVISSVEDAEIFMEYAKKGCPSLVPVHQLIHDLYIEQRYDAPRSFCHILHSIFQLWPVFCNSGNWLHLIGPIPATFPRMYLGDPHWGFSAPSVRNPPSLLRHYRDINMTSIHLPSLSYAIRYSARHFRYTRGIRFSKVTWDKGGEYPRLSIPRAPTSKLSGADYLQIYAFGCTNNWQLCMQVALDSPNCRLHWMSANVQQWVISLLMFSRDVDASFHALNPMCSVRNSNGTTTMRFASTDVSFYLSGHPETAKYINVTYKFVWRKRRLVSTLIDHIPALIVSVHIPEDGGDRPNNIGAIFSYLERHPMPMVVIFSLDEDTLGNAYEGLQAYMKPFRPLAFNRQADGRQYLFTCKRSEEHPFPEVHGNKDQRLIGIDPVTLAPTGQSWWRRDEAVEELLGIR